MNFTLHTNFSELDQGDWNSLLSESISDVPFLRYEYLSTWWDTRGGGEWPLDAKLALISAHENDKLIGIAPLFLAEHEGTQALMLLGSIEISDYLDLIVRAEDLPRFFSELLDYLASDSALAWSGLDWYNLPDNTPTLAFLKYESTQRGWTYNKEMFRPAPSMPLPGDWDSYLAGIKKKQRHEIRRKIRRAEESEKNVSWYIVEDGSVLDSEFDDFLALMSNDPHKKEFLTGPMSQQMRASAHAAFEAGWLQLAFMEADGQKIAGYLNFDYGNRIWVYNSGLDFNYRELSPGWVLLGYLIRWANENGRDGFDFLRGDEDYKYKFGGEDRHVMRVKIKR